MTCFTGHVILTRTMSRTPVHPLYDRILDGKLNDLLAGLVGQGLTPPQVRDRLRDEHKVDVSVATVRRWIAKLEEAA